jgi:monoterpene epsilon-lactone hydrolase
LGPRDAVQVSTDPLVELGRLDEMARGYLGDHPADTPLASPVHADLTGLPPTYIQVGAEEVFADDALRFAVRADEAGATVIVRRWPHMIHVWQYFVGTVPEADQAVREIVVFIDQIC